MDKKSRKIIRTDFANGKKHDFKIFKESEIKMSASMKLLADSGYQGIGVLHKSSKTPRKSSKKKALTKREKLYNRILSSMRILVENVIGKVKIFKIMSDVYRNRRRRFALRFNLIAGIYNFELGL